MSKKAVGGERENSGARQFNFGTVRFDREFWVDILGTLVPGFVFLIGLVSALGVPVFKTFIRLAPSAYNRIAAQSTDLFKALVQASGTLWFLVFTTMLIVTYVFGHLFCRPNLSAPDRASYHRLQRQEMHRALAYIGCVFKAEKLGKKPSSLLPQVGVEESPFMRLELDRFHFNGLQRWWLMAVRGLAPVLRPICLREWQVLELKKQLEPLMAENHAAATLELCDYPYPQFDLYLKKRKLDYLVDLVTWASSRKAAQQDQAAPILVEARSRLYINILKVRLGQLYPDRYKPLLRNEAHIRLASGLWHACGSLRPLAVVGMALTVLSHLRPQVSWVVPLLILFGALAWAGRKRLAFSVPCLAVAMGLLLYFWPEGRFRLAPLDVVQIHQAGIVFLAAEFWTLVFPITAFTLSLYFRGKIESFIHYQRLGEIMQVLDAAYFSFRHERWVLSPPFDDFAMKGRRSALRGSLRRPATICKPVGAHRMPCEFRGMVLNVSQNGEGACVVLWDGPIENLSIGDRLEIKIQDYAPTVLQADIKYIEPDGRVATVGLQMEKSSVESMVQIVEDDPNSQSSWGIQA